MHIVPLTEEYLDFALTLTQIEQWGTPRSELEALFDFHKDGILLAMEGRIPIGMTFCVPYDNFGFIGEVIVKEEYRGRGIGQKLMEQALHYLSSIDIDTIMLDSVVPAVSLYEKLGFRKICKSLRLNGVIMNQNAGHVRQMAKNDLPSICEIDRREFGADRSGLLKRKFSQFPRLCFVASSPDGIEGYIFAHRDNNGIKIGPWMADPEKNKPELFLNAVATADPPQNLSLGCLESNKGAVQLFNRLLFTTYGYSYRMVYGPKIPFSDKLFAIGGPDRG